MELTKNLLYNNLNVKVTLFFGSELASHWDLEYCSTARWNVDRILTALKHTLPHIL